MKRKFTYLELAVTGTAWYCFGQGKFITGLVIWALGMAIAAVCEAITQPTGDNMYEPHRFQIDSGTFWRCKHGETGWYACLACGWRHPIKFIKHYFTSKGLRPKQEGDVK